MRLPIIRFAAALVVFLAWLGWLLWLALDTSKPIVLAEPQFLVSSLDVIASVPEIHDGINEVEIRNVHWPEQQKLHLEGKKVIVNNLAQCKDDWIGPGDYILALMPAGKDQYRVAPLPRSPLFSGPSSRQGRPRIYPSTERTRMQLASFKKPQGL